MSNTASTAEVTLFVKAGDDGKRYGACPFCQRLFMLLLVKASEGQLHFQVATINLAKPADLFRKLGLRRVPAVRHGDTALDNVDEMIQYLDEKFPSPILTYNNVDAEKTCKDVFQKFCFYIKEVSKDSTQLQAELSRIDEYLANNGFKFLCANHMTHLDCELLPKLHHIRVASKALKGFIISPGLKHLWNYLSRAYKEEIFVKSCPSDQEIIVHWADKPETPNLSMEARARMAKEQPTYAFSTPLT